MIQKYLKILTSPFAVEYLNFRKVIFSHFTDRNRKVQKNYYLLWVTQLDEE